MELTGSSPLARVLCLPIMPSPIMTITPCEGTPSTTMKKAAVPGAKEVLYCQLPAFCENREAYLEWRGSAVTETHAKRQNHRR
jgi:hypothetical protein